MTDEHQHHENERDTLSEADRQLLVRAELALTQLNSRYGLEPDQSATLTAIRLRLEGKSRASLDDLLTAGKDLRGQAKDPLAEALNRPKGKPSLEDALGQVEHKPKKSLDDLF
jgi:hypothetical protein